MNLFDDYFRVDEQHPCPECGQTDFCLISRDHPGNPSRVICVYAKPPRERGDAGFDHERERCQTYYGRLGRLVTLPRLDEPNPYLAAMAEQYQWSVGIDEAHQDLAEELGVSIDALWRLDVGWCGLPGAGWTFPMRNIANHTLGIRIRRPDGSECSAQDGHEGLFIPIRPTEHGPLLLPEGPIDTATLLEMGFDAIGRSSARGGVDLAVEAIKKVKFMPSSVVVVANRNDAAENGAAELVSALARSTPATVHLIQPPRGIKDMWTWRRAGATAKDVHDTIQDNLHRTPGFSRVLDDTLDLIKTLAHQRLLGKEVA